MPNRQRPPRVSAATAARLDDREWMNARYVIEGSARGTSAPCSGRRAGRSARRSSARHWRRTNERNPAKVARLADAEWLRARYVVDGMSIRRWRADPRHHDGCSHLGLRREAVRDAGEVTVTEATFNMSAPDADELASTTHSRIRCRVALARSSGWLAPWRWSISCCPLARELNRSE